MALPAPEIINETMWVIYFLIVKKSSNFVLKGTNIDENFMINIFESKGKLSGFIKDYGFSQQLSGLSSEIANIDFKLNLKDAEKYFSKEKKKGNGWHDALQSQVKNLNNNQKISFINKLKILRQDGFYKTSTIAEFLKKVWSIFKFTGTYDRWNPADVWFYNDTAIREIQDYIKTASINNQNTNFLHNRVKKNLAIDDIRGLNKLILKLYEEEKLAPISLKKSTLNKAVYSSRIGLVNVPQNDIGRPTPPKVILKQDPIKLYPKQYTAGGVVGSNGIDLQYDIQIDQVILDMDGTKKYKRETDSVIYNAKGKNLSVSKETQFNAAQGGSLGMNLAEKILYTPSGSREIKKIRRDIFNKSLSSNIISQGGMIGKTYEDKLKNSYNYFEGISNSLNPSTKNKKLVFAASEINNTAYMKNLKVYEEVQNKLEISHSIKKSGKEDELILDLWSAITSKGITNRKDYERLVEGIGYRLYKKSKKPGQKRLTQDEADELAKQSLRATIMGNQTKVPGSFHLKLY
jgi:hypothetical protein